MDNAGGTVGWTAWILGRICMTCEGMGWMWVDLWGLWWGVGRRKVNCYEQVAGSDLWICLQVSAVFHFSEFHLIGQFAYQIKQHFI